MTRSSIRNLFALLAVLALGAGVTACGDDDEGGPDPAASRNGGFREGLAEPLGGIDYNVFITRQLNLRVPPDNAYYNGPEPPKGETFYGVFLQACNPGKEPLQTASGFKVVDNQGNEFAPKELPEENAFAYHPRRLERKECIPAPGSVAQLGPTAGSMLLFQLPIAVTENRPLELEIGPSAAGETLKIELDI